MATDGESKREVLRRSGALNPHPERVRDDLFCEHPFFDPCDLVQVRYEMLSRVCRDGMSIAQSARTFGFTRPTWYKARRAFAERGLAGLVSERPGPRHARKLGPEIMEYLLAVRAERPGIGSRRLVGMVEERFGLSVHRRSIERALRRAKN